MPHAASKGSLNRFFVHSLFTMSTKLYTFPGSANSSCARAVLMAGDVAFEEVNPVGYSDGPGGTRSTEYLAKFCNGQAPALEHGDVTVCENGAIAR